jgi:hypothetical protein
MIARGADTNALRFGNVEDWRAGICFTLEVTKNFVHQPSGQTVYNLAPAAFNFCFKTRIVHVMPNTNNLFHTNEIFACNTSDSTAPASVRQMIEPDSTSVQNPAAIFPVALKVTFHVILDQGVIAVDGFPTKICTYFLSLASNLHV